MSLSSESSPTKVSRRLLAFLKESPYERYTILHFLRHASGLLPAASEVLDAGAGSAPYRELFAHCHYLTADFARTGGFHDFSADKPDIECDVASIPLDSHRLDAIICTQVLEHVPDPAPVLAEFYRLLKPGGRLFLTVPLLWEVHEEPYDFWRYTPYSLQLILIKAGFIVESIQPRGGAYRALACMLDGSFRWLGPLQKTRTGRILRIPMTVFLRKMLAPAIAKLDRYDEQKRFTLGYACHCRTPLAEVDKA